MMSHAVPSHVICYLECPKCGVSKQGELTCCGDGGSWAGKCGHAGDVKFDHTWSEGLKVCSRLGTAISKVGTLAGILQETHIELSSAFRYRLQVVSAAIIQSNIVIMGFHGFALYVFGSC